MVNRKKKDQSLIKHGFSMVFCKFSKQKQHVAFIWPPTRYWIVPFQAWLPPWKVGIAPTLGRSCVSGNSVCDQSIQVAQDCPNAAVTRSRCLPLGKRRQLNSSCVEVYLPMRLQLQVKAHSHGLRRAASRCGGAARAKQAFESKAAGCEVRFAENQSMWSACLRLSRSFSRFNFWDLVESYNLKIQSWHPARSDWIRTAEPGTD